jgi:1,4-dihydroxy-2-naphthoate octaprenyltransferase
MKLALTGAFAVAAAAGIALAAAVGWELIVVGAVCFGAALAYSGGPKPYASYGLGERFVFVFFGLVATVGSAYVQDERITQLAYVASVPIGMLATAILVANNMRDIRTDRAANKLTLAVRIGEQRTRVLYQSLVIVALMGTFVVALVAGTALPLLALVATPFAVRPLSAVLHSEDPSELIGALIGTARLQLVYAALLGLGLWVA